VRPIKRKKEKITTESRNTTQQQRINSSNDIFGIVNIANIRKIQGVIQKDSDIICLPIGGTYLQDKYPSDARGTEDIDFVVFHMKDISESELERMVIEQLHSINCGRYTESNNPLGFKTNTGIKIHIYIQNIGEFEISTAMKERASTNHSLTIEDFTFLKLLPSDREKDIGDIIFILKNNQNFNWQQLFRELKSQLGKFERKYGRSITRGRVVDIGATLEQIKDENPDLVTEETMKLIGELYNGI
jgi:hypothetical protein